MRRGAIQYRGIRKDLSERVTLEQDAGTTHVVIW